MSDELPAGWSSTALEDIVEIRDALRAPLNANERAGRGGEYPYYGANGQVGTLDDFRFDGEHVLIAEDGGYFDDPSRAVAYCAGGKFWVNNHAHVVRPFGGMSCSFLARALNTVPWMEHVSGTTRLKLTQEKLRAIPLNVPPLAEQHRIVDKLDALQARSRAAKEALDAIPPLLEKFRQSVLAAAFRGDLTRKWREAHPDVEPAIVLLERIRAERKRRWEAEKSGKKYVAPNPVDAEGLPELPSGWCWASVEELTESQGVFDGARDHGASSPAALNLRVRDYAVDGVRVYRLENLGHLEFQEEKRTFISEEKFLGLLQREVQPGDILVGSFVADTMRLCLAPASGRAAICKADVFTVRPASALANSECLAYLLGSREVQRKNQATCHGVTRPRITTRQLLNTLVPFPPATEQLALVSAVRRPLGSISALRVSETAIGASLSNLDQSILAKAFRGELVPQDPNDEPAEALLARVRAKRDESSMIQRKRERRAT